MNVITPVDGTNNIRYADFVRVTTGDAIYRFATTPKALTIPEVDALPFDAVNLVTNGMRETRQFCKIFKNIFKFN